MKKLAALRIGTKIYAIVALLSLVALTIGGVGLRAMATYNLQAEQIRNASQRALLAEEINALIFSVVMDSRGVYMSRDKAEAEKFG